MLSEARLVTVVYWILSYAIALACLKPILGAIQVDKSIIDQAFIFVACALPGFGI